MNISPALTGIGASIAAAGIGGAFLGFEAGMVHDQHRIDDPMIGLMGGFVGVVGGSAALLGGTTAGGIVSDALAGHATVLRGAAGLSTFAAVAGIGAAAAAGGYRLYDAITPHRIAAH